MEFAEITKDPFINNTNNYFLVLGIRNHAIPEPTSTGGSGTSWGNLSDPQQNPIEYFMFFQAWNFEITGNLSNEAYSNTYTTKHDWLLVPPGFSFSSFGYAIGFWLTAEEVKQFILGGLSLKGGD